VLSKRVAIDLGASALRLHLKGEGVVLSEPALVLVSADGERVAGVGVQALSAHADGMTLRRPLRGAAIDDSLALTAAMQHLVGRALGRQRIFKPDVMVAVPPLMSGRDRREVMDAVCRAGARTAYLIDVPLAAAIGAGLPVSTDTAHLIVDLGADATEIAVIAHESTVVSRSAFVGGTHLTASIAAAVNAAGDVDIDSTAAEEAKREIGSAVPLQEERTLRLRGRDRRTALLGEVTIHSGQVGEAMLPHLREIAIALRAAVDECPPSLMTDVRERTGVLLTGGGARLRGIDRYLSAMTGLRVNVAAEPEVCTVRGAGIALESLDVVRRNLLYVR
jgi:rod shape-determining protein MreB